jgi:hypothetical protein
MTSGDWITNAEARVLLRVSSWQTNHLARAGLVRAVKVDEYWMFERDSVLAYDEARRDRAQRLPTEPLLRQVRLRGGRAACGVAPESSTARRLQQAAVSGHLTVETADELAVHVLGLTVWDVWPGVDG